MQRSRLDDSAPGRRKTRDASRAHAVRICATGLAPTLLRAPFLVLTATCSPRPCGKAVDRSIAGRADSAVVVGRFNTPAMPEPSARRRGLIVRQIIFWHQFCSPMLQNLRSQAMRLRSSMLALLTAAVFCAPATAPAMQLTVSIDGIFLSGLGLCTDIPAAFGGCIDLATLPIGINPDNGLPYDQVSLAATGPVTVDIAVPGSETFDQPWVFIPGDTGGASYSSDYHFFFDLDRNITISDGIQSITQTIHQQGDIIVGDFEDTLTIHASDPLEFVFNSFAPGQKLLVSMGTATATAGIDPDGTDTGTMSINAIPVPSSLALFGLGFTGLAFRRRRPA